MSRAILLALAVLLAGCSYGPVVDRSGFESAAVTAAGDVVFAWRVQRYRPAKGIAAFPDGGIPRYLDDRIVIASVSAAGGRPRVLERIETRGVPGSAAASLRIAPADPDHVLVLQSEQPSTAEPSRGRWRRVRLSDGKSLPYPDLAAELKTHGRALGSSEFGDIRVIDPDGTLLMGGTGPEGDELWVRRPTGAYVRLDPLKHFYGVQGDEAYYWSGDQAVVRNWRTLEARVIARYDPQTRQTSTLIRRDSTVVALEQADAPQRDVRISLERDALSVGTRSADGGSSYRPVAVDIAPLRR
jgi:hypothetical protein